jgi:hypothetical protein
MLAERRGLVIAIELVMLEEPEGSAEGGSLHAMARAG